MLAIMYRFDIMPVLNDIERAEVGTIYKQVGSFEAKRRGAALISRNISHFRNKACQRAKKLFTTYLLLARWSTEVARILSEIGWKVTLLEEATRPIESVLWMDLINTRDITPCNFSWSNWLGKNHDSSCCR